MKKRIIIMLVCMGLLASLFMGCAAQQTPVTSNDDVQSEAATAQTQEAMQTSEEVSEDTQVTDEQSTNTGMTPADSYSRYLEAKSAGYESISAKIEENAELSLTAGMALLSVTMVDLYAIGLTMLTDDIASSEVAGSMLGLSGLSIEYDGVNYTMTYTDTNDQTIVMEGQYDAATDSLICTTTTAGKVSMIMEYVKYNDGYAGQYFFNNEDGTTSTIKLVVDGDDIGIGMMDEGSAPASIFKTAPADFSFINNCTTIFTIVDGNGTYIEEGTETVF